MSSTMALDDLFDLDMALTMPDPETSVCNNNSHRKPTMDVSFAQRVREMVGSVCTVCMESKGDEEKEIPHARDERKNRPEGPTTYFAEEAMVFGEMDAIEQGGLSSRASFTHVGLASAYSTAILNAPTSTSVTSPLAELDLAMSLATGPR
ncbi:hypothetical protein K7X08_016729 [Anisodus acutangulus]|uniref:Uncharacterized protein n=1 Tax=Anisodus acutangulus TaxID=402998 RepID=A0A9Q1R5P3_9SOLA|nr:hypothetical protein K7X08_016729 [Anisodus acutangulus]